jgi:hypothetical protein
MSGSTQEGSEGMSVLVSIRFSGDVDKFRSLMESDPGRFRQIADRARQVGAIHHQFAVGEGFVLVQDEWESAEAFQGFFGDPQIGAIVADAGATGEPEAWIAEAIDSPDKF